MKIIVNGAAGKMGARLCEIVRERYELVGAADAFSNTADIATSLSEITAEADGIIDFSFHTATASLLEYAAERNLPVVIATTGHTPDEAAMIEEYSKKIPIFVSANMSVGVALTVKLAKQAASVFPNADIEIIEKHHNRKKDAPSGTALMIAKAVAEAANTTEFVYGRSGHCPRKQGEIGIHAIRMGDVVGEHEVLINTGTETITIAHSAHTRDIFAEGSVAALEFLKDQSAGLYNMYDMIGRD